MSSDDEYISSDTAREKLRARERAEFEEAQRCNCRRPVRQRKYVGMWTCSLCGKFIEAKQ